MSERTNVAPAEDDSAPRRGITIAAIDATYDEVATALQAGPRRFIEAETPELPYTLQLLRDKIQKLTLRDTAGSVESADRVMVGYLFGFKLLKSTNPDFVPSAAPYAEVLKRVQAFSTAKKPGADGQPISYFPTLEEAFSGNPEAYDHLLNKFSNEDARWGAQVLLLAAIDQVVVGTE